MAKGKGSSRAPQDMGRNLQARDTATLPSSVFKRECFWPQAAFGFRPYRGTINGTGLIIGDDKRGTINGTGLIIDIRCQDP